MIFGFNSDVKHDDIVYHVQSEAVATSQTLLSTVFVQGKCLGKRSSSYSDQASLPDFSEEKIHEQLKEQHRQVLEAIREGRLDTVIATATSG